MGRCSAVLRSVQLSKIENLMRSKERSDMAGKAASAGLTARTAATAADAGAFCSACRGAGLEYGPAFLTVEAVWGGRREAGGGGRRPGAKAWGGAGATGGVAGLGHSAAVHSPGSAGRGRLTPSTFLSRGRGRGWSTRPAGGAY